MPDAPSLLTLFSPKNIVVYMLVFTRMSGLFATAPFFSTFQMPEQVKIWFCALISFILYPILSAKAQFIMPHSMPEFAVLIAIEFCIGFAIGFIANLLFAGVSMVGELISIQMGLSMANVLDPVSGESSTIMSSLYTYLATIVFIGIGAYEYLFAAIYKSFFAMPVGFEGVFNAAVIEGTMTLAGQMFQIAFGLAMPIFSVLLVCDILLGMMNKVMPQMNIFMVSLPFKVFLGLILILVFLRGSITYLIDVMAQYLQGILHLFT